ncbi:LOW QUALITY PROTEIN: TATA element modulatory factor-like [Tigriopus californicus]|uniref:LOW QUALITY PROTEIN: TATA element modulatory factor-like n=1 Tax=Tigriopus californicus TaxID=6832 RepID=UPI0027DA4AA7|nr:LOW QUALITY PROTEIN: TATA element modulatory factor-like [Tigriopus californicus]
MTESVPTMASSWLNTNHLTSMAKSALTEAQKTIDKALDIESNEAKPSNPSLSPAPSASSSGPGLTAENGPPPGSSRSSSRSSSITSASSEFMRQSVKESSAKLWGSFTGSFFEAPPASAQTAPLPPTVQHPVTQAPTAASGSQTEPAPVISAQPGPLADDVASVASVASITSGSGSAVMTEVSQAELEVEPCSGSLWSETGRVSPAVLSVGEASSDSSALPTPLLSSQEMSVETLKGWEAPKEPEAEETQSGVSNLMAEAMVDNNSERPSDTSSSKSYEVMKNFSFPTRETLKGWEAPKEPEAEETQSGVSNLMAEAMVDNNSERPSDTSSSKSYEVMKNFSFPTSGQTSGDEFETNATSSDIEVIACPNGGGGHRGWPSPKRSQPPHASLDLTSRGHKRSGSEHSGSGSTEEGNANAEIDRLLRKLTEMNDVLEVREFKMVELSRANMELQEKNVDLNSQIKEAMKVNAKLVESNASNDDLTQRLATLENKLQRVMAEKDSYLEENKKLKKSSSSVMSENELNSLMSEKDEIIEDLRAEGQKLSVQVGKHGEIIKKLRVKEKANEKEIKQLKTNLEEKTTEADRLKKSLKAKDEVESKQIEAIQNLTSANSKWEDEHKKVLSELEDANEKVNGLKTSLEGAYREMAELKRGLLEKEGEAQEMALSREMAAKQALQEQLRELQDQSRTEKDSLYRQIDELRSSLVDEERITARKDDQLRREREDLMQRLEQSENRHEELSASVSAATRPLLRQIESLQASLNESQSSSERVERSLSDRLQQASIQLAAAQERERTASEQYMHLSSKSAALESKLNNVSKEKTNLEVKYEEELTKRQQLEHLNVKSSTLSETMKKSLSDEIHELKREKDFLEAALDTERQDLQAEKRKLIHIQEQLKERERKVKEIQAELDLVRSTCSSPSPSLSHLSVNGSYSDMWPKHPHKNSSTSILSASDEVFDSASVMRNAIGGSSNLYDTMRQTSSTAALVENLQAQLKQRDGEVIQMQMELGNLERARDNQNLEVSRLTQKVESYETLDLELKEMKRLYQETEAKYQTMLTMYGEKVEEAEELRLDLQDVKEMYKTQIQELLQSSASKSSTPLVTQ